jgi:hypothetical protein
MTRNHVSILVWFLFVHLRGPCIYAALEMLERAELSEGSDYLGLLLTAPEQHD